MRNPPSKLDARMQEAWIKVKQLSDIVGFEENIQWQFNLLKIMKSSC